MDTMRTLKPGAAALVGIMPIAATAMRSSAAKGAEPLSYEDCAVALEAYVDDQTRDLFRHPRKSCTDRGAARVYLSSIFKWFGADFVKTYGATMQFTWLGETERAVMNCISSNLDGPDRDYLAGNRFSVKYLSCDWLLNEQKR